MHIKRYFCLSLTCPHFLDGKLSSPWMFLPGAPATSRLCTGKACGPHLQLSSAFSLSRNCFCLLPEKATSEIKISAAKWMSTQVLYMRKANLHLGAQRSACSSHFRTELFLGSLSGL